jgi:hypothetical protein
MRAPRSQQKLRPQSSLRHPGLALAIDQHHRYIGSVDSPRVRHCAFEGMLGLQVKQQAHNFAGFFNTAKVSAGDRLYAERT